MKRLIFGVKEADNDQKEIPVDNSDGKEPSYLEQVDNRIYFYSNIYRDKILQLNKSIKTLNDTLIYNATIESRKPADIFLHINSGGGSVFSGFAGMDEIMKSKIPIITIIDGYCASAATFLSVVGKKRYMNKHSFILIHQLSSIMWGKYNELEDEKKNLDMLMNMIKDVYIKYTEIPSEKLDEILKHDLLFDAETCLKYKLVDEII